MAALDRGKTGIGFLGGGGQSAELQDYCAQRIRFRAVSREYLVEDGDPELIDIERPTPAQAEHPVVAAVGAPGSKRRLVALWPGDRFATIVATDTTVAPSAVVGEGSVIAPGARVMARTRLGRHVLVNTSAVISHECVLGDYSTVSPGVSIGGRCRLGDGAFVGIGATIRDGIVIGEGAVVGAGAVVLEDVEPYQVVAGVPAGIIALREDWLESI